MTSLKSVMSLSKNCYCFFKSFLSYLVCVPRFKSINSSFLSRKKYDGDKFPPTSVSDYEVNTHR